MIIINRDRMYMMYGSYEEIEPMQLKDFGNPLERRWTDPVNLKANEDFNL